MTHHCCLDDCEFFLPYHNQCSQSVYKGEIIIYTVGWFSKHFSIVWEKDGPVTVMDYRTISKSQGIQLFPVMESAIGMIHKILREIYPDMRRLVSHYQMATERFFPFTLEESLLNDYARVLINNQQSIY